MRQRNVGVVSAAGIQGEGSSSVWGRREVPGLVSPATRLTRAREATLIPRGIDPLPEEGEASAQPLLEEVDHLAGGKGAEFVKVRRHIQVSASGAPFGGS